METFCKMLAKENWQDVVLIRKNIAKSTKSVGQTRKLWPNM